MKLFGRDLFGYKKEPETLYDFSQHGISGARTGGPMFLDTILSGQGITKKEDKATKKKPDISAKQVYKAGGLNAKNFEIRTSPNYIENQLLIIDKKLNFLGPKPKAKKGVKGDMMFDVPEWGATKFGRQELESIKERLVARGMLKVKEISDVVDKYPHTTSQLISDLLTKHRHLAHARADSFVPDFPKDAMQAMEEYNKMCIKATGKKTTFYVIAKHEDFEQVNRRRDPILLAQSPFGHFWQILGAWDEEMVFLGDL